MLKTIFFIATDYETKGGNSKPPDDMAEDDILESMVTCSIANNGQQDVEMGDVSDQGRVGLAS